MKKKIVLIAITFIFMFSYASAQNIKTITADELKSMVDKKIKLYLVDARTEQEFSLGHIPKAVNIPPAKVGIIGKLLPKNKKMTVVFYCRGIG